MSLLSITGLSHNFGDGYLFKDAALSLNKGEHAGVVGQNGAGKSTLIKICTEQIIPDKGRVSWQPNITVGYLDQYARIGKAVTVKGFLQSAFASLYRAEEKMTELYNKASQGDMDSLTQAAKYQEELEAGGFYAVDTEIERVAAGLGLLQAGLDRPIDELSGGQRAKAILGKLLLEKPDVMLLDEPTNFLDKEHITWLAAYLSGFENAFMVVSHDFAFLDRIATHVVDIDNGSITKYYGTYTEFLAKKTLLRENYIRQYAAQQREIKKTEEFIRRNIAGRKTRMAQGRRKLLNRMERMEALDQKEYIPDFRFSALPASTAEQLSVDRLTIGYQYPILSNLDFSVKGGQKVVITGFNGIGKSTLLKTLMGQLPPLDGSFTFAGQARLGYFEQDLSWEDGRLTPIQIISAAYPSLTAKEVRRRLSRYGVSSKHALQDISTLSGGEQAKVKMCLLTLVPCNFLLLDEPTNHLDKLAKGALQSALMSFSGTLLLVSHEEAFYRDWANRIINVENSL